MSKAKQWYVSESVSELEKLLAHRNVTIGNRIRMFILIKNNESSSLSNQSLGKMLGVSSSNTFLFTW